MSKTDLCEILLAFILNGMFKSVEKWLLNINLSTDIFFAPLCVIWKKNFNSFFHSSTFTSNILIPFIPSLRAWSMRVIIKKRILVPPEICQTVLLGIFGYDKNMLTEGYRFLIKKFIKNNKFLYFLSCLKVSAKNIHYRRKNFLDCVTHLVNLLTFFTNLYN